MGIPEEFRHPRRAVWRRYVWLFAYRTRQKVLPTVSLERAVDEQNGGVFTPF